MPPRSPGELESRAAHEDGAAAVEFALLLPLLMLMILGVVNFGRAYNAQISLTQAAREGVRGVALQIPGWNATTVTRNALPSTMSSTAVATTTCPAVPAATDNASVTATYQFTVVPGLGAMMARFGGSSMAGTITLTGKGVMRCGG